MDDELIKYILDQLQNNPNIGYFQRQTVPEDDLVEMIMRRFNLGPTGRADARNYAQDLRIFTTPGEMANMPGRQ